MSADLIWATHPVKTFGDGIDQYADRVTIAITAATTFIMQKAQDFARTNARWEDRTGNARSGLFGVAQRTAEFMVEGALGHTVDYGPSLELDHGGRYAIILRTLEIYAAQLWQLIHKILAGPGE